MRKQKAMNTEIINKITQYFSNQPVLKAWLFGSYSRGEETPESDVDIIVVFDPLAHVSLLDHVGMQQDLEDILQKDVDLVTDGTFYPWVIQSVNKDKVLIYERKTA